MCLLCKIPFTIECANAGSIMQLICQVFDTNSALVALVDDEELYIQVRFILRR